MAPVPVLRALSPHDVEEEGPQRRDDGAHAARADRPVVHARHGGDLHAGAAEEHLVGERDLRAIDARSTTGTSSSRESSSITVRRVMPSSTLSRDGRRDRRSPADEEDVGRRGLRDVSVLVEDDGFVEAGALRVGLGEGGIDVGARDLAARRNHRVVHAPPGRDRGVQALVVLDVAPVGHRDDRDLRREVVQPDADRLVGVVRQRPDVAVLAVQLGAEQIDDGLGQGFRRLGQRHVEQAPGFEKALKMLLRPEDEELRLAGIPVAAQPRERGGAVVQGVRQDSDAGLGVGNDATPEERVAGQRHGRPPSDDFMISPL